MFVSCHKPKKVRVGRSDFYFFLLLFCLFAKKDFVDKIGGKSGLQKLMVKHCENSVFRVIFVKKKKKDLLGSGPFLGTVG